MKKVLNFFLWLFLFIVFCIIGIFVGLGVGYGILILDSEGAFSSWDLLSAHQHFEKIVTADPYTVWAQATDLKIYSWNSNCNKENCNEWIEVRGLPEDLDDPMNTLVIGDSCEMDYLFEKEPQSNVIECARVIQRGPEFGGTTYYALLENGKILMWKHSGNSIILEVGLAISVFFGFIAGILAFFYVIIRRTNNNNKQAISLV